MLLFFSLPLLNCLPDLVAFLNVFFSSLPQFAPSTSQPFKAMQGRKVVMVVVAAVMVMVVTVTPTHAKPADEDKKNRMYKVSLPPTHTHTHTHGQYNI